MANPQFTFHNSIKRNNSYLSINEIASKAKLIVCSYFQFSQQVGFVNIDNFTWNIVNLVISYFGFNIYDLNIKQTVAARLWLISYDAGNIYNALLHLMYTDLVKLFRKITGIKKRYPKHSEIKPFFLRHGGVARTDKIQSIHCSKFDEFMAWFIGICYIIKDLMPYYQKLDDPLNCLFYDRKTTENRMGTKYGRFILRLSSNVNCLVASYVNKQHRIKHICLKRLQNALYQIGNNNHNKEVELINGFIKPWPELEYLFMEYKDERKSLIFGGSHVNDTSVTDHKHENTDTQLHTNIHSISRNDHIKSTSINDNSKLVKKPMDVHTFSLLKRDSIELPKSLNDDDEKKQPEKDNTSNSRHPTINVLPTFTHYQQQRYKTFHQRCDAMDGFNYQQANNITTCNVTNTLKSHFNNANVSHSPSRWGRREMMTNNMNMRRDDEKSNNRYSPPRLQRRNAMKILYPPIQQVQLQPLQRQHNDQRGHLMHPMGGMFRRNLPSVPYRRIHHDAHPLELVKESHSNFTDPENDIDIEFEVDHYEYEPKWLKELHNYDNKTKLIVCGYFRVSQTELFSNLYIIPWMIVYVCMLYYNLSTNDIDIKDKIAAEIWVHSIRNENENMIEFQHLYPNLIYSFKQFTECKQRQPTSQEIVEFFMKNGGYYHSDVIEPENLTMNSSPTLERLLVPSIEINEFHKFYQWFISMCRIITDLKVIYERSDDPLTGLFYESIRAENELKFHPEGVFLLRLSESNELIITYKNHRAEIKDELLIRISKGSYTVAKTRRDVKLLKFIRNEQKWKYIYTPNNLIKKKHVFGLRV